ncbi:MAG TPA: tRNA (cytidine(34)-2'-O)-methyltransferase [Anaeromyxobacteraceae bacterium]|nr:tRNA (cytidine(34)-2'-O)-methyltransferase [Anaeromyxobacteraceae bacterium]
MPSFSPPRPPLQVVLVSPQIPPNTGNAARTCVVSGSRLHLVGPIGFSLDQSSLLRAGLDYWASLKLTVHAGWHQFETEALQGQIEKLHLFSGRADRSVFERRFSPGDFLVFGSEQAGLPPALLGAYPERCLGIPMMPGQRSLNLATAVGIGVYQALRSLACQG